MQCKIVSIDSTHQFFIVADESEVGAIVDVSLVSSEKVGDFGDCGDCGSSCGAARPASSPGCSAEFLRCSVLNYDSRASRRGGSLFLATNLPT